MHFGIFYKKMARQHALIFKLRKEEILVNQKNKGDNNRFLKGIFNIELLYFLNGDFMNKYNIGLKLLESAIENLQDNPEIKNSAEKVKRRISYLINSVSKALRQDQIYELNYKHVSLEWLNFHAKNSALILSQPSLDLIPKYRYFAITAKDQKYNKDLAISDFLSKNGLRLTIVVLIAGFGLLLNNRSQPSPVKWIFCIMTLLGVGSYLIGGLYSDYVKSQALSKLMLELSDKVDDLVDLTHISGLIDLTNAESTLDHTRLNYASSNSILFNQESFGLHDLKDSKEAEELESQEIKYPIG